MLSSYLTGWNSLYQKLIWYNIDWSFFCVKGGKNSNKKYCKINHSSQFQSQFINDELSGKLLTLLYHLYSVTVQVCNWIEQIVNLIVLQHFIDKISNWSK